jgi:hypothetical protein
MASCYWAEAYGDVSAYYNIMKLINYQNKGLTREVIISRMPKIKKSRFRNRKRDFLVNRSDL